MAAVEDFDALLDEATRAAVAGWRFPFLDERIRTDALAWDYSALARDLVRDADRVLDHGTGGGEVLSELGMPRELLVATEGYPPNVSVAADRLRPRGIPVVQVSGGTLNTYGPDADKGSPDWHLPFADAAFDLVLARHVAFCSAEVYRVLRPGGRFLHEGGRVGERRPGEIDIWEYFPGAEGPGWGSWNVAEHLSAAGFVVDEYREQLQRTRFLDIAAVVFQLRAATWAIPDFTVAAYRERLWTVHTHIQEHGGVVTAGTALLAIATKPSSAELCREPAARI